MEVAITKMSENGQVVIPAEVRRDAKIGPRTKFIVFNAGGNILLKQMKKDSLMKDMELMAAIGRSEEQMRKGRSVRVSARMRDEEIDDLLMR